MLKSVIVILVIQVLSVCSFAETSDLSRDKEFKQGLEYSRILLKQQKHERLTSTEAGFISVYEQSKKDSEAFYAQDKQNQQSFISEMKRAEEKLAIENKIVESKKIDQERKGRYRTITVYSYLMLICLVTAVAAIRLLFSKTKCAYGFILLPISLIGLILCFVVSPKGDHQLWSEQYRKDLKIRNEEYDKRHDESDRDLDLKLWRLKNALPFISR